MAITRTAMVDDDGSGTTGTVLNNAWKQEFYNQIDALAAQPVQTYTPVWSTGGQATGMLITIGNGTNTGYYRDLPDALVWFQAFLGIGSTTTFPQSWGWAVTLPKPLAQGVTAMTGLAFNAANKWLVVTSSIGYAQECDLLLATSPLAAVTTTTPFTWGNGHILCISGVYRRL